MVEYVFCTTQTNHHQPQGHFDNIIKDPAITRAWKGTPVNQALGGRGSMCTTSSRSAWDT